MGIIYHRLDILLHSELYDSDLFAAAGRFILIYMILSYMLLIELHAADSTLIYMILIYMILTPALPPFKMKCLDPNNYRIVSSKSQMSEKKNIYIYTKNTKKYIYIYKNISLWSELLWLAESLNYFEAVLIAGVGTLTSKEGSALSVKVPFEKLDDHWRLGTTRCSAVT